MQSEEEKYVLVCPECGSRTFEVHDPQAVDATVHCAECRAEVGRLDEVMATIEARIERREQKQRRRGFH